MNNVWTNNKNWKMEFLGNDEKDEILENDEKNEILENDKKNKFSKITNGHYVNIFSDKESSLENTYCNFFEIISDEEYYLKEIHVDSIRTYVSMQDYIIKIEIHNNQTNNLIFQHKEIILKNTKKIKSLLPNNLNNRDYKSNFYTLWTQTEIPNLVEITMNSNDFKESYPSYGCYPFVNFKQINNTINDFKNDKNYSWFSFCSYGGDHEMCSFGSKICYVKKENGEQYYVIDFENIGDEFGPWCDYHRVKLYIDYKNKEKIIDMLKQYKKYLNKIYDAYIS